jgi:hypothetical protein
MGSEIWAAWGYMLTRLLESAATSDSSISLVRSFEIFSFEVHATIVGVVLCAAYCGALSTKTGSMLGGVSCCCFSAFVGSGGLVGGPEKLRTVFDEFSSGD